jgi:glycosyltransferase involved in cell wall biosynthesis
MGLRRVVQQEQPDIVHAHNWLVHSFLPLKAWSDASLIVTLHDYSLVCSKKRLMYRGTPCTGPQMAKCLSCAVDHYGMAKGVPTVIGNYVMSAAERMMVDMFLPVSHAVAEGTGLIGSRLPFQVIPNFVPDDFGIIEGEADEHLAGLPEEDYLLFVGDVGSEKGLNVLLEAYGGLIDAPPLVLIGRTFDDQQNAFPPNITVLKSLPHRAVMHAWRRSLAVLVPSIWPEPFGLVVIEAMSSGSPVIASLS